MNKFRLERLTSLVYRVKVGFVGSINDFYCSPDVGVPIIRTTDIDDIDLKKLKYVTKEFHLKNKKSQLNKGDLIIARHGNNGNAVVYNLDKEAQVLNAVIIEPDNSKINSELLKIFFDSPYVKKQILGCIKGSVQGVINTKHISDLMFNFNDDINYDYVARTINNIDKKIELNNQINQELEAMAKLLYDYWFVQFDFPNEEGKPYKSSGGKMVYNEDVKREVPEGWSVKAICEWIEKDKSGDWGKESEQGNYIEKVFCIRGADINGLNGNGEVNAPERFILEKNRHKLLESGDLIIEISGGSPTQSTGRMAFITQETLERFDDPLICSNFCKAVTLKDESYLYNFVYQWNRLYDAGVLFGWEGKTSGIKNFLFESFVTNHHEVFPEKEIVEKFYDIIKPIQIKKQKGLKENQHLAELRDWLLPMLMNGQVKVKDAKVVEEELGEALGVVAEGQGEYCERI